ncbi:hypothetical protein Hanom_Chr07g00661981 [Helianthus anomalus]
METNQLITLLWSVFWLKPYGGMCVGVDYALLMGGGGPLTKCWRFYTTPKGLRFG